MDTRLRASIVIALTTAGALAPRAAGAADTGLFQTGWIPWDGAYVGAGLSGDYMPNQNLDIGGHTVDSKWRYGWGINGAVGYRTTFGLRPEFEFSFREQKDKDFNTNRSPWFGTQWDLSYMFDLLYDIKTGTRFVPYVGGGIGGTHITWGDNFKGLGPTIYDGTHTKFGWQLIGGVSYAVTPRLDVNVDLHYKGANGFAFKGNAPNALINNWNYRDLSLILGIRYALAAR